MDRQNLSAWNIIKSKQKFFSKDEDAIALLFSKTKIFNTQRCAHFIMGRLAFETKWGETKRLDLQTNIVIFFNTQRGGSDEPRRFNFEALYSFMSFFE